MIKFKVEIGDENTEYTTSSITKDTAIDLLAVAIIVLNLTHAPKWHIEVWDGDEIIWNEGKSDDDSLTNTHFS